MDTNTANLLPDVPRVTNGFQGPDAKVHLVRKPGSTAFGCNGRTVTSAVILNTAATVTCRSCLKPGTVQRVGSAFLTDDDRVA